MPNPTVTQSGNVEGAWLLPYDSGEVITASKCWIGIPAVNEERRRAEGTIETPFREEELSQSSVVHLRTGVLVGDLRADHGKTAAEWKERLDRLFRNQRKYNRVMLATNRDFFRVELVGEISYTSHPEIVGAWRVSLPFRELRRR